LEHARGVRIEDLSVSKDSTHLIVVNVVFHRSYQTPGGRNEPLLVAVLGLVGWRNIVFGRDVTISGMLFVLARTLHMVHEI